MRKGKMVSQGAHASLAAVLSCRSHELEVGSRVVIEPTVAMRSWLDQDFTKIVVGVNSEEELVAIHQQALEADIPCSLIRDLARTEFSSPTLTACAVGPALPEEIDPITRHLPLL